MARKNDEPFFVGVSEPLEMRRTLLEASKNSVLALQRFERFKSIRKEKAEEISNLKIIIKDLVKLNAKLRLKLPKTKLRYSSARQKVHAAIEEPEKVVKEAIKKTDLEKLDFALTDIEAKLSKL